MHNDEINALITDLGIRPNSKLGQVFLANEKVVKNQIEFAKLNKNDVVLEIGPGLGILTTKLASVAKKVVAVELDKKLYKFLKKIVPDNVDLILGDVLKLDLPDFNKVVANIPYQISSPLIFKLITYNFDLAVLMFQSEFAMKLIPSWKENEIPKKYKRLLKHLKQSPKHNSRLTIMTAYYFDVTYLASVPRTSFFPVPKIDSAIIQLKPKHDKPLAQNEKVFKEMVRIVFSERRKMIKNSILNHFNTLKLVYNMGKMDKTTQRAIVDKLSFQNRRPEELTLEDFVRLSNELDGALKSLNVNAPD
jgi:16S rRNA (adenine1518-N6/adenine1519-N6)-dimethyltransferase